MINPNYLFVLEERSTVFQDGFGTLHATRVGVVDYYSDFWFPSDDHPQTYPAYKTHGAHGKTYIKEADVRYIVDLTDDELRPVEEQ